MRSLISIFKNSLRTIAVIVSLVFVCLYVAAHYNLSGYLVKNVLSEDLSNYLGTEVQVDNAEVDVFNQIVLEQLLVKDLDADTLLFARRAKVSFNLLPLLKRRLEIYSIQFIDFDINLSQKDSISAPNYKFIIDLLANSESDNSRLDAISINSILMRNGSVSFDNYHKPQNKYIIDPNHLQLNNISSNLKISSSKHEGLNVKIKRLAFEEESGLSVKKLSAQLSLDSQQEQLTLDGLTVECQQTIDHQYLADINLSGKARYSNQQVNADIEHLVVNVPTMLNIKAEGSLADALSKHHPMSFEVNLSEGYVSTDGLQYLLLKHIDQLPDLASTQLCQIDDMTFNAKAEGDIEAFDYALFLNTSGKTILDTKAQGSYKSDNPYDCNIDASISNLLYKDHNYDLLTVDGQFTEKGFTGHLTVDDASCNVDVQGQVDCFHPDKTARLKAHVANFSPYTLNLTKLSNFDNVNFNISTITADVHLVDNNKFWGSITLDSLLLNKSENKLLIPVLSANATKEESIYTANIKSSLFDVTYIEENSSAIIKGFVNEEKQLSEILSLPIAILQESDFVVELNEDKHIRNAYINIAEADYSGNRIKTMLTTEAESDYLKHNLSFDFISPKARFSTLLKASSTQSPLTIDVKPCLFQLNDSLIECNGIKIAKIDNNTYDLQKFDLCCNEQRINAEGTLSTEGNNNLLLHIENLELDSLFNMLGKTYLRFGGIGTGDIVYSTDSVAHVKTNQLFIKDFSYLSGVIGDTHLEAFYDLKSDLIELDADIISANREDHSRISGYVKRGKIDSLDLTFDANTMRIDFLSHWLNRFLHDFRGNMTGQLRLFGPARRLNLVGNPYLDASFTNNLVGSRFNLRDSLMLTADESLENGHISMNNVKIYDKFGQMANVNASIKHKYLLKYNYDVQIDMPSSSNGFLLFDKPTHFNNETYWGQLYTSGTVMLRGGDGKHRVDVGVRTEKKSYFNLSPGEEHYSDNGYNFLTFRDKKAFEQSESLDYTDVNAIFDNHTDNDTYIELSLQAQATENCQVYVQMDPLAEDRLICRGTGNISLHYDPRHDITIGGEYNITSGNYLITMRGDLMNKEFKIQNGSRVTFPGNFSNAELNINAVYGIPSVNLRDLDESFATMASMNRTTLPVDCKLAVTGQLSSPQIEFDIEVKNTSDDVQALVHNLIGTQEMLNREVLYLLLFNRFYTPEYATASQNNAGSQLSSFASSSLTSQLNNLLGHVSDNFTLGTNFRSDKGDFSDMEMDLSLSTRLWGDRLILNGNLGYRDPANRVGLHNNTNSFIGDFDVEFLINTSGSLRAKAYSHYNERDYSINNALTTQGIGFIVRKDFKTIKELLFWKKMTENKKKIEKK